MNTYAFMPGIVAIGIRNFGEWVQAAYQFNRIRVLGDRDFPKLKIDDATLDEAFAWIFKGVNESNPEDALTFIWEEIMREGCATHCIRELCQALAGTGDIKAVTRRYVHDLITDNHMEMLLDMAFGEDAA